MAALTVITGVAVAFAVLAGTGFVPSRTASAQVPEAVSGNVAPDAPTLAPVEVLPKAEGIRQPSGLGDIEAQAVGTRKPTAIRSAVPAPRAPVTAQTPASAPIGDGWKSAKVSWYGPGFYGNGMAGGGTLQPDSMVVAHRSLPFGTRIEFSYNGSTCIAVVQDRGPYAGGRVFDLGPGTAAALGFSGVGTVQYRIL
jgi:rare lipoprotein A